jgi:tetratricopeptide (TPR) repeat protein
VDSYYTILGKDTPKRLHAGLIHMARYALVIGIADYDSTCLPTLKKSATDAEAVARVLEQCGTFQEVLRLPRRWIKEENRYEIIPKRLTGEELIQALRTFLLEQATKQEALIYFAGHGFQSLSAMGLQKGYLATSNCAIDGRNAIPLDELNWLINQSDLSSLVVLLDCCHAGSLLERNLLEPTLTAFDKKPDYYFITACRSFEKAYEGAEYGIFTGAILKGLSCENADDDGQVSSDRLFDYIRRELKGSGQEPIRMGRGRSITLVTYTNTNPVASPLHISTSPPDQPKNQTSRSGSTLTKQFVKRLWNHPKMLVSFFMISLLSGTVLVTWQGHILLGKGKPPLTCNDSTLAQKPETLKIAIADFAKNDKKLSGDQELEELLFQELTRQLQNKSNRVSVCRMEQVVSKSAQARQLGRVSGAAVVIWGSRGSELFVGGIEVSNWNLQGRTLPSVPSETLSPSFQTNDLPKIVTLLSSLTLSNIYYFDNHIDQARVILKDTLEKPGIQELARNERNAKELAKAYLFLGILFDTPFNPECKRHSDCVEAREAYKKAYKLDNELYVALLNQGKFDNWLEGPEKAIQTYTRLIEMQPLKSSLAADALINRAFLYMKKSKRSEAERDFKRAIELNPVEGLQERAKARLSWGDDKGAIQDLQSALQQEPENPENYNLLGLAQLRTGQTAAAKQTYENALCYLDEEFRDSMLDDLTSLVKKKPELTKFIEPIIAMLKVASIPPRQKNCNSAS